MAALFNQFRDLHARLGIDTQKLGCIMLDVKPIDFGDAIPEEWLYYSPTLPYCQGIPEEAHITLLYGLLKPGPEMKDAVDEVLKGWRAKDPRGYMLDVFQSSNNEPYACIVLRIEDSPNLTEAHARLSMLPHIDTFWEFKPHLTLAYVHQEYAQRTVLNIQRKLNAKDIFVFTSLIPIGINYGGD